MTTIFLQTQIQSLSNEIHDMKKRSNLYALLRFVFMIGVFADILIGYFQEKPILYLLSGICLILFMILVVIHQKLNNQILYKESLLDVYQEHILRKNNQWDQFQEDGSSYIDEKDYRSLDLDVFGHHSLFQMINVAFTKKGKKRLAYYLKAHNNLRENIILRQDGVEELSNHKDFVIQMQTYGRMVRENKEDVIIKFMSSSKHYSQIPWIFIILPTIALGSLICLLFSIGLPYATIIFEITVFLQLIISFLLIGKQNQMFEPVANLSKSLKSYLSIFELINNENFESDLLIQIKNETLSHGQAITGIKQLTKIADCLSYRQNIFAFILLNALGLYDLWMRNRYIEWLNQYQNSIEKWFDGLSEIEVLMSLTILKIDEFSVTKPIIKERQSLSFQQLKHPLIHQDKVVGNDFALNHNVCIITGSNMSGKTTFMRTVGLNLILAYAGGYVLANQFECSLMNIMTSMRVKDNVEEGVSTFYGELLRIKDMIDFSKKQFPMICFIDEIFKGTNSLDRIAGAKATVQQLSSSHCLTFLTTHDFELCEMKNLVFDNFHFDEYYQDHQIYFDYHIKNGKSQSTNGQFLLRQLGIIQDKE